MGRRHYKRLRIELPVTVSGLDTQGNPFTQSATAVEISARGLRLRGVSCLRGRGDPLDVKYKNRSARYRIAWIGTSSRGLVGLEGLEDAALLFAEHLSPDLLFPSDTQADPYVVSGDRAAIPARAVVEGAKPDRRQQERRRHPRFNCSGSARIWQEGQELSICARLSEISLCGCYLEMMSPMRAGTCMRLELCLNHRTVALDGIVRNSQPNYGMGIEFTRMPPAEADKLHRVISEVSGAVAPEPQPVPAPLPQPASLSRSHVAEAVLRWFGSHDTLTRGQFLELVEEIRRAGQDLTHA